MEDGKHLALIAQNIKGDGEYVVCPGMRGLINILRADIQPEFVLAIRGKSILEIAKSMGCDNNTLEKVEKIKKSEIDEITARNALGKTHHTGTYSLIRKPLSTENHNPKGIIVWINNPDNLRNIGTAIRSSVASGIKNIIIDSPDKNPWHAESIQASCGYIFYLDSLNIFKNEKDAIKKAVGAGKKIISLSDRGEMMVDTAILKNSVLVFGNERRGVSERVISLSDKIIRLPMLPGVSSYNLSASIAIATHLSNYDGGISEDSMLK